jgi:hypothetical protein
MKSLFFGYIKNVVQLFRYKISLKRLGCLIKNIEVFRCCFKVKSRLASEVKSGVILKKLVRYLRRKTGNYFKSKPGWHLRRKTGNYIKSKPGWHFRRKSCNYFKSKPGWHLRRKTGNYIKSKPRWHFRRKSCNYFKRKVC